MATINPYFNFNGNCREAMTFYKDCLGGDLLLQTVAESPMSLTADSGMSRMILHASLTSGSLVLMGSDMSGQFDIVKGNKITLSLSCGSRSELDEYFSRLSTGGQVIHPVHDFFAGTMGTLTDKFETDWLIYCERSSI